MQKKSTDLYPKYMKILLYFFIIIIGIACQHHENKKKPEMELIHVLIPENGLINSTINISIKTRQEFDSLIVSTSEYRKVYPAKTDSLLLNPGLWFCGENEIYFQFFIKGIAVQNIRKIYLAKPDKKPEKISYEIVGQYPHDPDAYTQGLFFFNGYLYESTGKNGASSLRKVELTSGRIVMQQNIDSRYFCEGIAMAGNKIYQLTWETNIGFVYEMESFKKISEFSFPTEGWGLTSTDNALIMSDGSESLYFLNIDNFECRRQLQVYNNDGPVKYLNELELIDGKLYANIYHENVIVTIDTITGSVLEEIDCAALANRFSGLKVDVLNGIAFKDDKNKLLVTGKLWPLLFEIKLKNTK